MKTKLITFCVTTLMALNVSAEQTWDGSSSAWARGSGTATDPYLIETPQQFAYLSEMVDAGVSDYYEKYFKQMEDFNLNNLAWTPIGNPSKYPPFKGNYDGNDKYISNFKLNAANSNNYLALFGYVNSGSISNVTVKGTVTSTATKDYVAAIVAYGRSAKLMHCVNNASLPTSSTCAGGIIADAYDCTISNCSNTGAVSSISSYNWPTSGGIVGSVGGTTTITQCSNTGAVSSSTDVSNSYSGGIVGLISGGTVTITQCSNTGAVSSFAPYTSLTDTYSGGIVGCAKSATTCSYCYARGTLESSATHATPYCCGIGYGVTASNCYFVGTMSGPWSAHGITTPGSCSNCYFNDDCCAHFGGIGTAKTQTQMKSVSFLALLNNGQDVFQMDVAEINDGFPIFNWQVGATYTITSVYNETEGLVSGGGTYEEGTTATLTATPNEGYYFVKWSDGNTVNPRQVVVTQDSTFSAIFVSNKCGDDLYWSYENGQLSITGTGAMYDYISSTQPWASLRDSITSLNIGLGATTIGSNAFASCKGLTSVTIPNSVITIENYAFYGCSGLASVTIPNSVTTIGSNAFVGCSGLTSITISNSVTEIKEHTFHGCTKLTTIDLPNSIKSIGQEAFNGCSGLTSVIIPNSVTTIGGSAFSCSALTSITIPNSVTSIGGSAFGGCSSLSSVTLEATTPPSLESSVWYGISSSCVFYIPCGTKAAYQQAWGNTYHFVEKCSCETVQCTVVNDSPYGTVSFTGEVLKDSEIALKATAPECSQFIKWSDNNTDNPRSIEMTQDSTFTAIFEKIQFNLSVDVNDSEHSEVETKEVEE